MAKVTISTYSDLPRGLGSQPIPVAPPNPISKDSYGATGDTGALADNARFIRVATDTAICIRRNGTGADGDDDMMPANSVEFFGVDEGATVSWLPA